MDQVCWQTSAKLTVPANITVVTLPSRSPELNPVENIWQFIRDIHKTLRVTPAMAAGVTDQLWEMRDIVALIDANEPERKKRGPYKKQISN